MPKGTRVDNLFEKLKAKGLPIGEAAAVAQKQTKQSLHTGKKLPSKKEKVMKINVNPLAEREELNEETNEKKKK